MRFFSDATAIASLALPSFSLGRSRAEPTGLRSRFKLSYLVIAVSLIALAVIAWLWASRPSPIHAAKQWGLPGVWQHDCKAPVRADNPRYRYDIEHGKLLLRRDFGGKATDESVISDLESTSTGEIRYVVHFAQLGDNRKDRASRQNVLVRSPEGRIRTLVNKDMATGSESVIGGIRVADKKPTPWMTRCSGE